MVSLNKPILTQAPSVKQIEQSVQQKQATEIISKDRFKRGFENAQNGGFKGDSYSFAKQLVSEGFEVEGLKEWDKMVMTKKAEAKRASDLQKLAQEKRSPEDTKKLEEEKSVHDMVMQSMNQFGKNVVGAMGDSTAGLGKLGLKGVSNLAEEVAMFAGNDELAQRMDRAEKQTLGEVGDVGQDKTSAEYKGTKFIGDMAQIVAPGGLSYKFDDVAELIVRGGDDFIKSLGLSNAVGKRLLGKATELISKSPTASAVVKGAYEGAKDTLLYDAVSNSELASKEELGAGAMIGGIAAPIVNYIGGFIKGGGKKIGAMNIDDKTKTALNSTSIDELDEYIKVAENAKIDVSNHTAFEHAARKTEDALNVIDDKLKEVGSAIGNIRGANGDVIVADPGDLINKWNNAMTKSKVGIQLNPKSGLLELASSGKVKTLPQSEKVILDDFIDQLNSIQKSGKLEISDLIDLNTFLNNNFDKVEKASKTLKSVVSEIKSSNNDLLMSLLPDEYKGLMKQYSDLLGIDEVATRFYGETGERGSTFIRSMFGSNAMRTRDAMNKIKDITGVDLFKEGQIAKFVSEALDDKRGLEQMLENIPTNPVGIVTNALKSVGKKIADPIKGAKGIIEGVDSSVTLPGKIVEKLGVTQATD